MTHCERAQNLFGPAWDDALSVAEREAHRRGEPLLNSIPPVFDACGRIMLLDQQRAARFEPLRAAG